MGDINELMTRTTNRNFYNNNKSEGKVEEFMKALDDKDS